MPSKIWAHALENLLNLMRKGAVVPTSAMINTLLAAADVLTGRSA